jgi:hypothetical protein
MVLCTASFHICSEQRTLSFSPAETTTTFCISIPERDARTSPCPTLHKPPLFLLEFLIPSYPIAYEDYLLLFNQTAETQKQKKTEGRAH